MPPSPTPALRPGPRSKTELFVAFSLLALVLAAAFAGVADNPQAQGALRGMGAVAAGLIAAAGLRLVPALKSNVMGMGACVAMLAATFIAIALLRIPLAWVLLGIGGVGCVWAYVCLGKLAAKKDST